MTAAMACFAINDTIVKSFADELGLGQVIFIRGVIASFFVYLLAVKLGHLRPLAMALHPLLVTRSVAELVATFTFLTALFHVPIANAAAILQALPLAITLVAAMVLRDPVGWRRLTAILIGFSGVLLIVRPGTEGFSAYSLFVVVTVAACVVRDLSTRQMHAAIPALFITLVTAVSVTLMGGVLMAFETWQNVTVSNVALLALSSLFLIGGYFNIVSSMRVGDIAFIAPFRYTVLLFSIIGGMVAFHEFPDATTWLGSAIIVATGIYTLYRERVIHRQSITSAAPLRT